MMQREGWVPAAARVYRRVWQLYVALDWLDRFRWQRIVLPTSTSYSPSLSLCPGTIIRPRR
jgi:hypothetical protein